jgi:hypothetical protein
MAQQRSTGKRQASSRQRASSNGRLSPAKVIRQAREQIGDLTGRPVESVLGFRHDDDGGGWEVLVEVVELRRVPNSTDVLGSYLLTLDEEGDIQEYRRTRRYHRNQVEEGQS